MIRAQGRYRNQTLEPDQPLALAEGAEVEIDVHLAVEASGAEHQEWAELGMKNKRPHDITRVRRRPNGNLRVHFQQD